MATVNPIQVQKYLVGMDYPADKQTLINHAKSHGANNGVIQTLQELPAGSYRKPVDVSRAIGQVE